MKQLLLDFLWSHLRTLGAFRASGQTPEAARESAGLAPGYGALVRRVPAHLRRGGLHRSAGRQDPARRCQAAPADRAAVARVGDGKARMAGEPRPRGHPPPGGDHLARLPRHPRRTATGHRGHLPLWIAGAGAERLRDQPGVRVLQPGAGRRPGGTAAAAEAGPDGGWSADPGDRRRYGRHERRRPGSTAVREAGRARVLLHRPVEGLPQPRGALVRCGKTPG